MFARSVTMRFKPNTVSEFNKTLEKEVLPLLQKQKGFRDELTLVSSNGSEVLGIRTVSWDQETRRQLPWTTIQRQFLLRGKSRGTPTSTA